LPNHEKLIIIKPGLTNVDRSKVSKVLKKIDATKAGSAWQVPGANADQLGAIADLIGAIAPGNGANADRSGANADKVDPAQLKADLAFFFRLFQKNAGNLSITGDEKVKLKNMLGRLRE